MDVPVVGVPGTLRPMKGHAFLLASAMAIRSRIPNVHIIISGTGQEAYQQELRHLVQQNGLEETVQFLGNIEDMRVFYKACTVACIPSVAEPFGRTVIEAFASRVPVVGSAVGGIKETIQHKENGLLVPYGDTAQLVEALVKVVEDPAFARKIVARARGDAEQLYHERVYKARIGSLIERQCEGHRASIMNKP
jgi:glycosyltransferase involved in cell wall biosynthesis